MYIYLKDQNEKGENMDISKVAEKEDLIDNSHVSKNNEEIQAGKKAKEIEFKTQRFSAQLSSQIKSYIETELKGYGAENMKFTLGGQKFAILENSDKIFQKAIEKGIDSAISDIKLEMENCSDSSGSERERRLDIFFNKTLPNALSSSIDINSATVPERIINEIDSSLKNGTATKIKNINKHQEKVNENINKLQYIEKTILSFLDYNYKKNNNINITADDIINNLIKIVQKINKNDTNQIKKMILQSISLMEIKGVIKREISGVIKKI